ncbi:MAG TPA: BMP family ABC transporter substrate-binding protein [Clostridiales bacterium]|nr:BMP family ABC transporter substrate-binding protein [Clostridiales bacterium]
MKKVLAVVMAMLLVFSLAACGNSSNSSSTAASESSEAAPAESSAAAEESAAEQTEGFGLKPTKDPSEMKVALVMLGAISDLGWDYTASIGLQKIAAMGPQTSYKEKVAMSDLESVFRTYASEGYDVIFYATSMGEEAVATVAKDFPDTQFIVVAGNLMEDNIVSIKMADEQQGFMLGAIAAMASKSGIVGFVGANEIVPVVNGLKGFEQGAKYVNPNIQVLSTFTGSDFDVNLAKEVALAMIDQGADVLSSIATAGTVGVLEACVERGIYAVSESSGLAEAATDAVLTSVTKDASIGYEVIFKKYLEGQLPNYIMKMGAAEGVVYYDPWNEAVKGDGLTDEQKAQIEQIYQDMAAGKIEISID